MCASRHCFLKRPALYILKIHRHSDTGIGLLFEGEVDTFDWRLDKKEESKEQRTAQMTGQSRHPGQAGRPWPDSDQQRDVPITNP